MIPLLCLQEKLIIAFGLSKDKDDNNEGNFIKTYITDLAQPLQFKQADINSSYLLDQYNKNLFMPPVSCTLSSHNPKWYQKQFWFHQTVLSTFISIPKAGSFQLDQIYTLSDLTGHISNSSLFDINKTKEKDKSNNSLTHIVSNLLLSDQNHMPMNCCTEYFVIFTKNCVNDISLHRKMWNIPTVSLKNIHRHITHMPHA